MSIRNNPYQQIIQGYIELIAENPFIDSFNVFNQNLAISYKGIGLIVVADTQLSQIVYVVDDPFRKFNL